MLLKSLRLVGELSEAPSFLGRLPNLEALDLTLGGEVDGGECGAAMAALAPRLRVLDLIALTEESGDATAIAKALARFFALQASASARQTRPTRPRARPPARPPALPPAPAAPARPGPPLCLNLEVRLEASGDLAKALARRPLAAWGTVRALDLSVETLGRASALPLSLLKRIATDLTGLRELSVWNPLPHPLPTESAAAFRGRLRRLRADVVDPGAAGPKQAKQLRQKAELEAALGIEVEPLTKAGGDGLTLFEACGL
eukprot:tig00020951_g16433.t1